VALGSLKLELGHQTLVDNSLVLGAILILVVLLIPRGFAPSFTLWRQRLAQAQVHRRQARGTRRRRIALQDVKQ
jgi:branched-chain amino acid transport system permease protein